MCDSVHSTQLKKRLRESSNNWKVQMWPEAQFIVPDWEDIVDYDIGVVVPTRQVRQPYAIVDFIPQSRTMNLATVLYLSSLLKKIEI